MESFWSSMQPELLDRSTWTTRAELTSAISEWIEAFHDSVRRHSGLGYPTPTEYEAIRTAAVAAA